MTTPPGPPTPFVAATLTAVARDDSGIGWVELSGDSIAREAQPGQFAMVVRPQEPHGHQGRPYAYFRVLGPHRARFLTRERLGQATSLLRAPLGTPVPVRGPLGRPFARAAGSLWAVAGGVGAAAFGGLCAAGPPGLQLFVGLRDQTEMAIVHALAAAWPPHAAAPALHVSSDNGTVGTAGSVVALLQQALEAAQQRGDSALPALLLACGPEGMLRGVAKLAAHYHIPCEVSVGIALPCGVGSCGLCLHRDHDGRDHLACLDGPTYPASLLY